MLRTFLTLVLALSAFLTTYAQQAIRLPMTYGNSMVLQRNRPILLQASAQPRTTITAILQAENGKSYKARARTDAEGR